MTTLLIIVCVTSATQKLSFLKKILSKSNAEQINVLVSI